MKGKKEYQQLNGLALAYVGDAIYEIYIREYLVSLGYTKPNQLHRQATHFVSAKAQAGFIKKMLAEKVLTEEEEGIFRRGRNAKSHTSAKNVDVSTYRYSTGFEAVLGYLHLMSETTRLEEIINWSIEEVAKKNGK